MRIIDSLVRKDAIDYKKLTDEEIDFLKEAFERGKFNDVTEAILNKLVKDEGIDYSKLNDEELEELKIAFEISEEKEKEYAKRPLIARTAEKAMAAGAGFASGLTYGLPESKYVPEFVEDIAEDLKYRNPTTYKIGDVAGMIASPVGKIGATGKLASRALKSAGVSAAESTAESLLKENNLNETAKQAETAALLGGALTAGTGVLGKTYDALSGMYSGFKKDIKDVYNLSKIRGNITKKPEFSTKLQEDIFNNYDKAMSLIDTRLENVAKELEEKKKILDKIKDEDITSEIEKTLKKALNKVKSAEKSLVYELNSDKKTAINFLNSLKNSLYLDKKEIDDIVVSSTKSWPEQTRKALRAYLNRISKQLEIKKDLSITDILNLKRDLYTVLDYDKIKFQHAGAAMDMSKVKQFDYAPIKKVLTEVTADIKNLSENLDEQIMKKAHMLDGKTRAALSKMRPIKEINKDYHDLSILEEKKPTLDQFLSIGDTELVTNAAYKTKKWADLFKKKTGLEGSVLLDENKNLRDTLKLYTKATGKEFVGTIGISARQGILRPSLPGYSLALQTAATAGDVAKKARETYPKTTNVASSIYDSAIERIFSQRPAEIIARTQAEKDPEMAQNLMTNIFSEAQAKIPEQKPELEIGIPMERSYSAVKRNSHILIPKLKEIDPMQGVVLENAIRSEDVRTVEGLMSVFASNPVFEPLFQPSPIKTSVGDVKSAVVVPNNKVKIVSEIDKKAIIKDIVNDEAKTEVEKMKKIDQLNRAGTIDIE